MNTNQLIKEITEMICADHCDGFEDCKSQYCGIKWAVNTILEKSKPDSNAAALDYALRVSEIALFYGYDGELADEVSTLAQLIVSLAKKGSGQKAKAIEELAELIQALAEDDYQGIVEESADVWIMLEQIACLKGIPDDSIERWINEKLTRQERRIMDVCSADCTWR